MIDLDDYDPDQQRVMGLLAPHLDRLFPIFGAAVDMFNSEVSRRAIAELNTRAIANSVWCHLWAGLQREFLDEPGFHFIESRGLSVVNINDELVMRVKKVDENGRHQNADTEQQRAFDQQLDLPDIPPAATRIVMGYQPDEAFSQVERVLVRRPKGRWVSQVVVVDDACAWIDITPAELPFDSARRAAG